MVVCASFVSLSLWDCCCGVALTVCVCVLALYVSVIFNAVCVCGDNASCLILSTQGVWPELELNLLVIT